MIEVHAVVKVEEPNCIGCKACDNVCPTEAIVTVDRLARVDEDKCTACFKCIAVCVPHNAIVPAPRTEPLVMGITPDEYNAPGMREQVEALCAKAMVPPDEKICFCLRATGAEGAAAVINGAKCLEDITLATGIRGICATYCAAPLERLLDAAEIDRGGPEDRKDWRTYPSAAGSIGLWNVPASAADKWPEYYIKEDQEKLKTRGIDNPIFTNIAAKNTGMES